jgi:nucleoid-associated protein YgaU
MPSSAFRIDGFGDAAKPIGNELSHAAPAPHIEHQLNSPMDIGRAHQFFQPAQPAQAIGHAAIATPGAVAPPGSDIASLTAKALSAAQQQISPIIQLIMRMPGHIGVMSSVFEAFSNFFMGHADFLGAFDPHLLAMHGADATAHLDASKDLLAGEHMHVDMHMLPHDAPILGDANFHGLEHGMEINSVAGEHSFDLSYVNEHLLDHSNLNVSGTLDGAKSQFEGLSFTDPHGEIISGPSLSQASPATHLASGHRVFLDQSFSRVNSMGTAGSQAIAASTATPSVTSALSQPLSTASTSLNVGANAFGQQASALPAVANTTPAAGLGANVSDGGSLSGFSGASDTGGSSMGAPGNPAASSDLKLALNKAPEGGLAGKGFGTNEYGANYINEQSSGAGNGLLKGLKAKELSLDDSVKNHNLAQASTPQSPSAHHPAASHTADSVKHAAHKASAEPAKHHAASKHLSSKSSSMSGKSTAITKPTEADAQVPGAEGADGGAQATQSNSEEIANAEGTDATKATDAPETTSYTVKEGDCLWNIAKDHLGDSSKWQEIYKLNTDVIGENPDLIHTGATIQLPGGDHAAVADAGEAAKYVVKSGDNLWDIAKHNLGGGTKWGDIYKLNHDVIGENPSLIHPGQEFNLGAPHEGVDTGKLADANVPGADAPGADAHAAGAPTAEVAQAPAAPAAPTGPAPSAFGTPSETAALPEFGSPQSAVAQHAPVEIQPSQPDPHMFSTGAATAAPAQPMAQPQSVAPSTPTSPTTDVGPGAAGAATLPEFGSAPVSPDKSSLVSSSMMSSLQDFLTHKK